MQNDLKRISLIACLTLIVSVTVLFSRQHNGQNERRGLYLEQSEVTHCQQTNYTHGFNYFLYNNSYYNLTGDPSVRLITIDPTD